MHHIANKVRLYPNRKQAELFEKTFGCTRWIYNYLLDFNIKNYKKYKNFTSWKPPTEAELKKKHEWLREPDATALQQARIDLQTAFKNFTKHGRGYPRFKRKGVKDSFRCQMTLAVKENKVRIGKNGWVTARGLRNIQGLIKNITVFKEAGKYYASILYEKESKDYFKPNNFSTEAVGIDLGVVKPIAMCTSKGKFSCTGTKARKSLKELERRRKWYQRKVARKAKGSNNRNKARYKLQKAYAKERNVRKEFIEQTSYKLASNAKTIIFEDLNLKGLTKQGKGKHGLNRELLRLGLSTLIQRTKDKAARFGSSVLLVDPKYTSQICSSCGVKDKRSRESQSRYVCTSCGFKVNADFNAAKNILVRGLAHQGA